jgi:hypothetical protein
VQIRSSGQPFLLGCFEPKRNKTKMKGAGIIEYGDIKNEDIEKTGTSKKVWN